MKSQSVVVLMFISICNVFLPLVAFTICFLSLFFSNLIMTWLSVIYCVHPAWGLLSFSDLCLQFPSILKNVQALVFIFFLPFLLSLLLEIQLHMGPLFSPLGSLRCSSFSGGLSSAGQFVKLLLLYFQVHWSILPQSLNFLVNPSGKFFRNCSFSSGHSIGFTFLSSTILIMIQFFFKTFSLFTVTIIKSFSGDSIISNFSVCLYCLTFLLTTVHNFLLFTHVAIFY